MFLLFITSIHRVEWPWLGSDAIFYIFRFLVMNEMVFIIKYVMYAFENESTLCSCLNVKELRAQNRHNIWSLSDSNGTQTHNHLVHKQTLCELLSVWCIWLYVIIMSQTLFRVNLHSESFQNESTLNLLLPECQGTPCSKQVQ